MNLPFAISKLARRFQLWIANRHLVACFEGILISDPGKSEHFCKMMLAALELVKSTDPHRFDRIQKYVKWIVNCTLDEAGAAYFFDTQTCAMDFEFTKLKGDSEFNVAFLAKTLVHEATHGFVRSRNINYTPEFRSRIERLCVAEENRFVKRLAIKQPQLAKNLFREYEESKWEGAWKQTRGGFLRQVIFRR